jgi:hypothetical protein
LGKNFKDHLHNINLVLDHIKNAGLKLKHKKCFFFQEQVQYLGHIVSKNGISADPSKIDIVKSWPTPSTGKEVQRFLGFAGYYRRFVRNFSELARLLHQLTERNCPFQWTSECAQSFAHLRERLSSPPILAYPRYDRPFILDTDANDYGLGAVLSQINDNGQENVIAFGSRMLTKSERKYCVTRKELLAVVTFIKQFRPYLLGRKFTLRTDHGSLLWLTNFKDPQGQLARWLEQLQEFDFEVVHRKGRSHCNADALSRLPCSDCGRHQVFEQANTTVAFTSLSPVEIDTMRKSQLQDSVVGPLLRAKEAGKLPSPQSLAKESIESRRLFQLWDQLLIIQELLYRQFLTCDQLVVPLNERQLILHDIHSGAFGGHLGKDKMMSTLKQRFYWPGYSKAVHNWCQTCSVCASRKTTIPRNQAPLQTIAVGSAMQMVAMDILGPLPESPQGNSYVLVVADYFTKWMEAFPMPNQEASTVAKILVNHFFCRFSLPERLHADQGRQFESELIAEICTLLHIEKTRTTPYHPQSDGLVERLNRTLTSMLATCIDENPFQWEEELPKVCMAYNSSEQATTGYSPFYLMFGREARMPVDLLYPPPTNTQSQVPHSKYAVETQNALRNAYHLVREKVARKHHRQKELYNRRIHGQPYKPGALVWLFNPAIPKGRSKKFHRPWTGPYTVIKQLSEVTYQIKHFYNHRLKNVHFDRLKHCTPNVRLPETPVRGPPVQDDATPMPPPGTHMELLDQPDVHHYTHTDTCSPLVSTDHASSHTPRYPGRSRQPPIRYGDYITY